tara:strand:- start:270 stop:719 length:450 start_codon:yes stop_codon:yes gene_type:complete
MNIGLTILILCICAAAMLAKHTADMGRMDMGRGCEPFPGALGYFCPLDGRIVLNRPAIIRDFNSGFKYWAEPSTASGRQKNVVFRRMKITPQEFRKIVKSAAGYIRFIELHELAHKRLGHKGGPLMAEGTIQNEIEANREALVAMGKLW